MIVSVHPPSIAQDDLRIDVSVRAGYWQCLPNPTSSSTKISTPITLITSATTSAPTTITSTSSEPNTTATQTQTAWGQCGGIGWAGPTTCIDGYYCGKINDCEFIWPSCVHLAREKMLTMEDQGTVNVSRELRRRLQARRPQSRPQSSLQPQFQHHWCL